MKTIPIPGGAATFRESEELRGRDRKIIKAAAHAAVFTAAKLPPSVIAARDDGEPVEELEQRVRADAASVSMNMADMLTFEDVREVAVIATLASWTLDRPLPTLETIGDLPGDLYEALLDAAAPLPASADDTDFSPTRDKESPTSPSGSSNGDSEGEVMSESPTTS